MVVAARWLEGWATNADTDAAVLRLDGSIGTGVQMALHRGGRVRNHGSIDEDRARPDSIKGAQRSRLPRVTASGSPATAPAVTGGRSALGADQASLHKSFASLPAVSLDRAAHDIQHRQSIVVAAQNKAAG